MKHLLICFVSVLFFNSCSKELNEKGNQFNRNEYNAVIIGEVYNEFGLPVQDALIEYSGHNAVTDKNGVYFFKNVMVNDQHNVMRISKAGFFDGFRTFNTKSDRTIQLKTIIAEKKFSHSFDAKTGGTITHNSVKITFPSSGIIYDPSGQKYSGKVNVAIDYMDPLKISTFSKMPGNLTALDSQENRRILATFGMAAIEMQGENGEHLQLSPGKKATLEFDLPPDIVRHAPSVISLWYFDERSGYWKEEGSAVLEGSRYKGDVGHFSFWNVDLPFPLVEISGKLLSEKGILSNCRIKAIQGELYNYGNTDHTGSFNGFVRKGVPLKLSFNPFTLADGCEFSSEIDFGPIDEDKDLGNINVSLQNVRTFTFSGKATNCAGKPVNIGYIKIDKKNAVGPVQIMPVLNGAFSGQIFSCLDQVEINYQVVDLEEYTESKSYETILTGDRNFPDIPSCIDVADYFTVVDHKSGVNEKVIPNGKDDYFYMTEDIDGIFSAFRASDSLTMNLFWPLRGNTNMKPGIYKLKADFGSQPSGFSYLDGRKIGYSFISGRIQIINSAGKGSKINGVYTVTMSNDETKAPSTFTGSFRYFYE